MAHIHEKIDFTVAIFVVHDGKILLIHHRQLDKWLPLGGHIELDEDPEQAALREAKEESGLDVELLGERPPTTGPGTRALIPPRFLDIHRINETHEHIGMIYWARPKAGSALRADRTNLPTGHRGASRHPLVFRRGFGYIAAADVGCSQMVLPHRHPGDFKPVMITRGSRPFKAVCFTIEGFSSFFVCIYSYYLYFLMRDRFGFSARDNLAFAALNGLIYTFAALQGGRFGQRRGYFNA